MFLRNTEGRTVLAIVPVNTLQNWLAEFNMWMPNEADPRVKEAPEGAVLARQFHIYCVNDNHKTMMARAKVVGKLHRCHWCVQGQLCDLSVLLCESKVW